MQSFAVLIDALSTAPGRNARLKLIGDWVKATPDPDRGYGLAAMTGDLPLPSIQPAMVRGLIAERVDPVLFDLSYDYVGDLAETVSLLWPTHVEEPSPTLSEVVEALQHLSRSEAPATLTRLMDRLDASGRFALLKLAMGNFRVGVGARLVRMGFAQAFGLDVEDVTELWHGLKPPYAELFAWGEGRAGRPDPGALPLFRPFMLAHPLEQPESFDASGFAAEWKWDGIRCMAVRVRESVRLYSRDGNDISAAFPEIVAGLSEDCVLDGELLVRAEAGAVGSFNALQQRLGRKTVSAEMKRRYPVFLRCYDLLFDGETDVRDLSYDDRRTRLERLLARLHAERFDFSPEIPFSGVEELAALRADPPDPLIEGLMLKLRASRYVPGRKAGLWYKWKRDPRTADCVLMYAQRGHGKRSSYYSDFTFGAWDAEKRLLPVGKAYFGFTDVELKWLDQWVRNHTVARFGPVREVEKALVLEVAFDSIAPSGRHKSGLAMRFPRISRIRQEKPAAEASTIDELSHFCS